MLQLYGVFSNRKSVILDIQSLFKIILQKRSIVVLHCQSQRADFCLVTCFVTSRAAEAVDQWCAHGYWWWPRPGFPALSICSQSACTHYWFPVNCTVQRNFCWFYSGWSRADGTCSGTKLVKGVPTRCHTWKSFWGAERNFTRSGLCAVQSWHFSAGTTGS